MQRYLRENTPRSADSGDFERQGAVQQRLNTLKVNTTVVTELMRRKDITPDLVDSTVADIRAGPSPPVDVAAVVVARLRGTCAGQGRRTRARPA